MLNIKLGYKTLERFANNAQVGKRINLYTEVEDIESYILTSTITSLHRVSDKELFVFTVNSAYQVEVEND